MPVTGIAKHRAIVNVIVGLSNVGMEFGSHRSAVVANEFLARDTRGHAGQVARAVDTGFIFTHVMRPKHVECAAARLLLLLSTKSPICGGRCLFVCVGVKNVGRKWMRCMDCVESGISFSCVPSLESFRLALERNTAMVRPVVVLLRRIDAFVKKMQTWSLGTVNAEQPINRPKPKGPTE
jgi:hypothetical protein